MSDVFFLIALICACICAYLWGHLRGYKKGRCINMQHVINAVGESTLHIFKELKVEPAEIARASRQVFINDLKKTGMSDEHVELMAETFLKKK